MGNRDKGIVFVFKINDLSSLNISDEGCCGYYVQFIKQLRLKHVKKCRGDKIIKLKIVIEGQ